MPCHRGDFVRRTTSLGEPARRGLPQGRGSRSCRTARRTNGVSRPVAKSYRRNGLPLIGRQDNLWGASSSLEWHLGRHEEAPIPLCPSSVERCESLRRRYPSTTCGQHPTGAAQCIPTRAPMAGATMTSAELQSALARLDRSPRAVARPLGVDVRTARRWATGGKPIPDTGAAQLTAMIAAGGVPTELAARRLSLLEQHLHPMTWRRLAARSLGLRRGAALRSGGQRID